MEKVPRHKTTHSAHNKQWKTSAWPFLGLGEGGGEWEGEIELSIVGWSA